MTHVRRTSIEVYHEIEANGILSKRRWDVYKCLFQHGPLTRTEIGNFMRIGSYGSNISARLTELREMGAVEEIGEKICNVSNMNVILWDVTDKLPIKIEKSKDPTAKEIIQALCKLVEAAPKWFDHPKWKEKSAAVLKAASKYRGDKKNVVQ